MVSSIGCGATCRPATRESRPSRSSRQATPIGCRCRRARSSFSGALAWPLPLPDDHSHAQEQHAAEITAHQDSLPLDQLPLFTIGDNPLGRALANLGKAMKQRESPEQTESPSNLLSKSEKEIGTPLIGPLTRSCGGSGPRIGGRRCTIAPNPASLRERKDRKRLFDKRKGRIGTKRSIRRGIGMSAMAGVSHFTANRQGRRFSILRSGCFCMQSCRHADMVACLDAVMIPCCHLFNVCMLL